MVRPSFQPYLGRRLDGLQCVVSAQRAAHVHATHLTPRKTHWPRSDVDTSNPDAGDALLEEGDCLALDLAQRPVGPGLNDDEDRGELDSLRMVRGAGTRVWVCLEDLTLFLTSWGRWKSMLPQPILDRAQSKTFECHGSSVTRLALPHSLRQSRFPTQLQDEVRSVSAVCTGRSRTDVRRRRPVSGAPLARSHSLVDFARRAHPVTCPTLAKEAVHHVVLGHILAMGEHVYRVHQALSQRRPTRPHSVKRAQSHTTLPRVPSAFNVQRAKNLRTTVRAVHLAQPTRLCWQRGTWWAIPRPWATLAGAGTAPSSPLSQASMNALHTARD
eukprot:COSAG01_NODE_17072_length_1181_cov_1.038817_1_plen_328_part_00